MNDKKFLIGLPLSADVYEWDLFLNEYFEFIQSVYFSVPLGEKFHSRRHIAEQFKDEETVERFWELLKVTKRANVELELVLNTPLLSEEDIANAVKLLDEHDISVHSVTCLDKYYVQICKVFQDVKINYSYNNFLNDISDISRSEHKYDGCIVGRQNVRNVPIFNGLRKAGVDVILLLNNGCSHMCGWCHSHEHCRKAFDFALNSTSAQQLYAEQSVMPFEINDGYIDTSAVRYFKINNRNSDLSYLIRCLKSYIFNYNNVDCLADYSLWGKLAWFEEYYKSFDLREIIEMKKQLSCGATAYPQYRTDKMRRYSVSINLCDEYTFAVNDTDKTLRDIKFEVARLAGDYKLDIPTVRIGAETCAHLYSKANIGNIVIKAKAIKELGYTVHLVFPSIAERDFEDCAAVLTACASEGCIDAVVINDYGLIDVAQKNRVKMILGRLFDKRLRDPRVHSSQFLNGAPEDSGIFTPASIAFLKREGVSEIEMDILELGLGEPIPEQIRRVYLHFPYRYITCGHICEFSGIGEDNEHKFRMGQCKRQCMKFTSLTRSQPLKAAVYKHCNALFEKVNSESAVKHIVCLDKVSIVYTPSFEAKL